ncbi:hypothetical protein AU476_06755 [Cupriavidus sp. UYMSc13B]|nr:hypothetical protein AU476_06755 [Cupriavidus sp. UYMSc13B]
MPRRTAKSRCGWSAAAARWPSPVADQGPGIPDYALPRVFERFYSLPRPHGADKSTGLGLCFAREVATLHHGDVTLANRPGGGALAELTLPAG